MLISAVWYTNKKPEERSRRNPMVTSPTAYCFHPYLYIYSATCSHGSPERHVLLRWCLLGPRYSSCARFQGSIPNILNPKRLYNAHSSICYDRRRGGSGWRRRPDIPVCPSSPVSFQSILPPYALSNELFLGRGLHYFCCCHHCNCLYNTKACRVYGKSPIPLLMVYNSES